MRRARSFEELDVYRRALEEAQVLFMATQTFPREERYTLTDQVLRSSRGVGALIAEAWARRGYRKAFAEKLSQAMAEAMETQAWLNLALECRYISADQHARMHESWRQIGAMLRRMIQEAPSFCRPSRN